MITKTTHLPERLFRCFLRLAIRNRRKTSQPISRLAGPPPPQLRTAGLPAVRERSIEPPFALVSGSGPVELRVGYPHIRGSNRAGGRLDVSALAGRAEAESQEGMLVAGTRHRLPHGFGRLKDAVKSAVRQQLGAVMPRITLKLILLALLGVLLFLCGLFYGVWLIIRFRHRDPGIG